MAEAENQRVESSRDKLFDRVRKRYPDRTFGGQTGQEGQDGQDPDEQLAGSVVEMLDEYDAKQKEMDENNGKLVNLFMNDPRSHEFVNKWVQSGDPLTALVEVFGDDFSEAMSSEEGRARFVESHNKWLERKSADDDAQKQREANWQKSLDDLEQWGNSKGLDEQKKVDIILRLHQVGVNAIENIYTPEDYEMAFNAMNYTEDVKNARREGEVQGRNAQIEAKRLNRSSSAVLPPSPNGQGMHVGEQKPDKPNNIWSGLE